MKIMVMSIMQLDIQRKVLTKQSKTTQKTRVLLRR